MTAGGCQAWPCGAWLSPGFPGRVGVASDLGAEHFDGSDRGSCSLIMAMKQKRARKRQDYQYLLQFSPVVNTKYDSSAPDQSSRQADTRDEPAATVQFFQQADTGHEPADVVQS
uniref:Uncharacterized protein n=1 Tax=Mus musculus TaxID=10090 RepID=Q3UQC3_MOUSE|nr:unnamed protein product [Mus musculus]